MNFKLNNQRPLVCGIVNVTPDSFSDGGKYLDAKRAIAHGLKLAAKGADLLDIGGESTRPGSDPVSFDKEMARVLPVIKGIADQSDIPISIDTMKPEIADAAMTAGASIWNDVSALNYDQSSLEMAAKLKCSVVLMHMQGQPKTMQDAPIYKDVIAEVIEFLHNKIAELIKAGIGKDKIFVDPGIGFGKTVDDNLRLLANLKQVRELTGCPIWLGASRKRFITAVDSRADSTKRLGGSLAALAVAFEQNVDVVRVHDVRMSVQMLDVLSAIKSAGKHP